MELVPSFRKAERRKARLRMALSGPSGTGKTYSALLVARGICGDWSKIAVIDTENGSADLYAHLGDYSVMPLRPPYSPERYIAALEAAEQAGFEVVILDSLSHAWAGEGGILDQQGKATDSKYKGNAFGAWREFTPRHNALLESLLRSNCHVIATLRSKTDYVQSTDANGKAVIKKVGIAPIQRDGVEYEFTVVLEMSQEHVATASKDRTSMFDGQYFKPTVQTGEKLLEWLETGIERQDPEPRRPAIMTSEESEEARKLTQAINFHFKRLNVIERGARLDCCALFTGRERCDLNTLSLEEKRNFYRFLREIAEGASVIDALQTRLDLDREDADFDPFANDPLSDVEPNEPLPIAKRKPLPTQTAN